MGVRFHEDMNDKQREHLEEFARSFVLKIRRDRWFSKLRKHDIRNLAKSSSLHEHLDLENAEIICVDDASDIFPGDTQGVFYDFFDEPSNISYREALVESVGTDAIFSVNAGKLAVYFFHEGDVCVFGRKKSNKRL